MIEFAAAFVAIYFFLKMWEKGYLGVAGVIIFAMILTCIIGGGIFYVIMRILGFTTTL